MGGETREARQQKGERQEKEDKRSERMEVRRREGRQARRRKRSEAREVRQGERDESVGCVTIHAQPHPATPTLATPSHSLHAPPHQPRPASPRSYPLPPQRTASYLPFCYYSCIAFHPTNLSHHSHLFLSHFPPSYSLHFPSSLLSSPSLPLFTFTPHHPLFVIFLSFPTNSTPHSHTFISLSFPSLPFPSLPFITLIFHFSSPFHTQSPSNPFRYFLIFSH